MVSKDDSKEKDLLEKNGRYGPSFDESVLNSKRSVTKGLNEEIFYGICYSLRADTLMVGINENAGAGNQKSRLVDTSDPNLPSRSGCSYAW
ncbi:hypothetical protein KIN20_026828 [Parelaphostrongylus tenuis]|uniref:Uncharacterized protein n=1 Tax=Parelaphostrongylus tenuis TaxID=148309 RepID=A0AAD5QYT9_PARTN|nr:hypothetical protein KIN20_026828 [Parelaphostrongylus tenuis]